MSKSRRYEIAVIGAGIAGIATAWYLAARHGKRSLALIDSRQPMSYTSAQSGDNYRNWWPHPVMSAFTNDSIDELDRLAHDTDNLFRMTRGGYVLATRRNSIDDLESALQNDTDVDIVSGGDVRNSFPWLANDIRHVMRVRRGGSIDGHQLGTWMLEQLRARGAKRIRGAVHDIEKGDRFNLAINGADDVAADVIVNAAGPFAHRIAAMLGETLPVTNLFQQKVAFEDTRGAIMRDMPFTIDLDDKTLDWTDEERELLAEDPDTRWLTEPMPGGTHCRPEGGAHGKWVKLGWAYNDATSEPREDLANEPFSDPQFPEIVMRGAARFIPALRPYVDNPPARYSHYGGYYTMTAENWPLIGPMRTRNAYMVAALSGFGSMAACAAGKLCAGWIVGAERPAWSDALGAARYADDRLMQELAEAPSKGIL
ncbi:MAG TPA: FAD-binding oxidoreductase [Woeseiaceae bacterium]|nr:FAD-binding oxidoreductase [Woeseiaceae bacterium]